MLPIIAILLILLTTVACILFVPIRPAAGPERDAGHEPQLIDAICPDCHCVRVNRIWRSESYRIAAGPSFPSIQCPACFTKQCQVKNANKLAAGRWLAAPKSDEGGSALHS